VFQVERPNGQILFKRTRVAYSLGPNNKQHFTFSRDLTDVMSLSPGEYPVKLQVSATVLGSTVTTEVASSLRVYSLTSPHVKLGLVARVSGQPMSRPDGRFEVDPGQATGARDAVSRISHRVLADPRAQITLSISPELLGEWRRLSGGYTLADGTAVRPDAPIAVAYNAALADLKAAIDTGRLRLASTGYSDPNLTDLADHGLTKDVGPQYDAGISATFASLEVTPSSLTAPAGACVPPNQVDILWQKGVRSIVIDNDCARDGKSDPNSGPYRLAHDDLRGLVVETSTTAALSRGDTAFAVGRAFTRLVKLPKQALVVAIDVDGDSNPATDTVSLALDAFEAQTWLQVVPADSVKPIASSARITLAPGQKTPHAPKGYWEQAAKARAYAAGYYAALGSSSTEAATAEVQSLVAESSSWSAPGDEWSSASRGLAFANAALSTTGPTLDGVSVTSPALTLSGSSGEEPVTIVNASSKTLSVVVRISSTGGVRSTGPTNIPLQLRPQENYLTVPVAMQDGLNGKLVIEVVAGDLVIAHSKANVQTSYLDRFAMIGAIVFVGLGVLVFIVRRVRSAPEVADFDEETEPTEWIDEDENDDISPR
jgi:hypothetical protein